MRSGWILCHLESPSEAKIWTTEMHVLRISLHAQWCAQMEFSCHAIKMWKYHLHVFYNMSLLFFVLFLFTACFSAANILLIHHFCCIPAGWNSLVLLFTDIYVFIFDTNINSSHVVTYETKHFKNMWECNIIDIPDNTGCIYWPPKSNITAGMI